MAKAKLKELPKEKLQSKEKNLKAMVLIFIPIILALLFFIIRDYFIGAELEWSIITIAICSIGGLFTVYAEWKDVRNELMARG